MLWRLTCARRRRIAEYVVSGKEVHGHRPDYTYPAYNDRKVEEVFSCSGASLQCHYTYVSEVMRTKLQVRAQNLCPAAQSPQQRHRITSNSRRTSLFGTSDSFGLSVSGKS